MMSVCTYSVTRKLGIDLCSTFFCMLQFFEHHHSCPLPHHKSIAIDIKGS